MEQLYNMFKALPIFVQNNSKNLILEAILDFKTFTITMNKFLDHENVPENILAAFL